MADNPTSQCFYDILANTVGVVPHDDETKDPYENIDRDVKAAAMDTEHYELYENPNDAAECVNELADFERRLAVRKRMVKKPNAMGMSWSPQAGILSDVIAEAKRKGNPVRQYSSRSFILDLFKDVRLPNLGITELDQKMTQFFNLSRLNLSGNKLMRLSHIPRNIESLVAYANMIDECEPKSPLPSCIHLGLGFNRISSVSGLTRSAPNLMILDLAYNHLSDLSHVVASLSMLPLKHVFLMGNPIALAGCYRRELIQALPGLETLDDIRVDADAKSSAAAMLGEDKELDLRNKEALGAAGLESLGLGHTPRKHVEYADLSYFTLDKSEVTGLVTPVMVLPEPEEPAKGKAPAKGKGKGKAEEPEASPAPESELVLEATPCPPFWFRCGSTQVADTVTFQPEAAEMAVPATVQLRDQLKFEGFCLRLVEETMVTRASEAAAEGQNGEEDAKEAVQKEEQPPQPEVERKILAEGRGDVKGLLEPTARNEMYLSLEAQMKVIDLPKATLAAVREAAAKEVKQRWIAAKEPEDPKAKGKGKGKDEEALQLSEEEEAKFQEEIDTEAAAVRRRYRRQRMLRCTGRLKLHCNSLFLLPTAKAQQQQQEGGDEGEAQQAKEGATA